MEFKSRYIAHHPDDQGFIAYSDEEHRVWTILFEKQIKLVQGRACNEFIDGLSLLHLNAKGIPQLPDLSETLMGITGWRVAPVEALISAREFFELLANKHFPVATFIRRMEELHYVKEPDIFHEVFGHCPMLTNPLFAGFIHDYACKVLSLPESDWALLQRMFWFTIEFGLIQTEKGLRAYGGGILSSIHETVYCVESDLPLRALFDPIAVFRTPYRIDMPQAIYFVINDFQTLFDLVNIDLKASILRAHELGEYPPYFPVDPDNPNIHILAC
jgi:phenylalanine-4-hydroxylase